MTNENTAIVPLVTVKDGKVFANSRDVAEYFGKKHYSVLEAIDDLVAMGVQIFLETPYVHPQNKQTYRAFDMTRDGFTLLAMGFTGAKALQFKLAYIATFNEMEAKLKSSTPALPNFADPAAAAIAWGVLNFQETPTSSNKTDKRITHMTCAPNFGGTSIR